MPGVAENDIRELVQRILGSNEFRKAPRLSEFLAYIVECRISSRLDATSETHIGRSVFGRRDGYNPSEDSIVRSEARLLRQKLTHYFENEGAAEKLLIEVPKGSYAPIIKPREIAALPEPPAAATSPQLRLIRFAWLVVGLPLLLLVIGAIVSRVWFNQRHTSTAATTLESRMNLRSSDLRLKRWFLAAKTHALLSVHSSGAVGDWYDAQGQSIGVGFNVRDVSHDSDGAVELGLSRQNRSMMRLLVSSVAASRDWSGYWTMTPQGKPSATDYKSDQDYRYCLPANFDLLAASYRQYLWTGDPTYFSRPFLEFYHRTIDDYVRAWDPDGDGIMQSLPERGLRGIPSYNQLAQRMRTGADLVAAQYGGYLAFANLIDRSGLTDPGLSQMAERARAKASLLQKRFNTEWWSPELKRNYSAVLDDGSFYSGYIAESYIFPLKFELLQHGKKADSALDILQAEKPKNLEGRSYLPGLLFQYGRNDAAYDALQELSDPDFITMPEVAFAIVDAVTSGLAGISPDASRGTIATCSHLPSHMEWVQLEEMPVGANLVSIRHEGTALSRMSNNAGPPVQWKASFPVSKTSGDFRMLVDEVEVITQTENSTSGPIVFTWVPVAAGQTRIARIERKSTN